MSPHTLSRGAHILHNVSVSARIFLDAELIAQSQTLDENDKYHLLKAMATLCPPAQLASTEQMVIFNAIGRLRDRYAPKEQGRKTERVEEQAEVASEGTEGGEKEDEGETQGFQEQAEDAGRVHRPVRFPDTGRGKGKGRKA